jgi:hypothetical protein
MLPTLKTQEHEEGPQINGKPSLRSPNGSLLLAFVSISPRRFRHTFLAKMNAAVKLIPSAAETYIRQIL